MATKFIIIAGLAVFFVVLSGLPFYTAWKDDGDERDAVDGRCRGCGYDLTGNASGICPECGATIEAIA